MTMGTTKADIRSLLAHPTAPTTMQEAGLSLDLMVQLALKQLHFIGELSGNDIAGRLGVRFSVVEPALAMLKGQHHIEVVGGSMVGASSFRYRITDAGRTRVAIFLEHNQYVGTAPVPLAQYRRYMYEWQKVVPKTATRQRVKQAFAHLVISGKVMDQLGPAINAAHSLFVYGPPGNGKTVISQAIRNLLEGDIAIPHALEVEGQIVRLYDPVNHEELPLDDQEGLVGSPVDRRWVRCRRPLVKVGGELTLESLELSYNQVAGFYHAPVQAVANGGVLVIDDFGRQQVPARQFLNRWIVPLESRVDFLTLQTGQKFDLPFMVLMVFATNVRPAELVDEAFLRRIHYKVFAESPTVEDFALIFNNCCRERGLAYDRKLVDELLRSYYRPRQIPLRGCHPRDLIEQALSLAEYRGDPPHLTTELLEAACAGYFVDDTEPAPVYA
jgi:predicted ATPase with chaperone activity